MLNLPNNTPFALIIESDNGYVVMTQRWSSTEEGQMGPQNSFRTYIEPADALASIERFMAERNEAN